MHVDRLVLDQFRTYEHLDLTIPAQGLRISGRNASGKTSVLEALVLLSTTKSPRASGDRDVVRWDSGKEFGVPPYSRLEAEVETGAGRTSVGVSLELDPETGQVAHKHFLVGGEPVRAHDLVGSLKCVLFSPEDVLLVSGAPSERRRQFDILLSQMDRGYMRALSQYGRVLAQRNQLLKRFARERRRPGDIAAVSELAFWDQELVVLGAQVMAHRQVAASEVSGIVEERSAVLVDGVEVGYVYQPRLDLREEEGSGMAPAQRRQEIAGRFHSALEQVRGDEFRRGMTLIGPHRDDYLFTIHDRELAQYGSRGQQRLGVIAYRLAEIEIIARRSNERPVLLLDDVLSELDAVHRNMVMGAVAESSCQILVTSTDASMLEHSTLESLPAMEIQDGTLLAT